ncbi:MAG TPA: hypothetical protein VEX38_04400 [Fimbriimonadaceae bacterium]|nr:hypothetical protein [Fimbriimonadaceae bacterium]
MNMIRPVKAIACLSTILMLTGCGMMGGKKAVSLAPGTELDLMLLTQLDAGSSKEGQQVPLMVVKDIKVDDEVVIPRGAAAKGKVAWSRSEGTLSALVNRPARLAVSLDEVQAADGAWIKLSAEQSLKPDATYQFTRENTSDIDFREKLSSLWGKQDTQKLLLNIHDAFQSGSEPDYEAIKDPAALKQLAEELKLESTSKLIDQGKLDTANQILDQVRRGNLVTLAAGDLALAAGAVVELAHLARAIDGRISRMLKGRTIRAHVGTVIKGYVAEEAKIVPQKG